MAEFGYGGRILRIDLTERRWSVEKLDLRWMREVIGGRAANTKRLIEELPPKCDPQSSENPLIFGIGPLTGTTLPASAYYTVTARSPLTGILGDSAAGGHFAAEMKLTGFDQFVITGCADELVYLLVTENGGRIIPCPELAGKNIVDTMAAIRQAQGNWDIQVAAIGVAGEHQVRFAAIVSSGNRVNGRSGMGAVMGSKNLKAVAVCGQQAVALKDPLGFMEQVSVIRQGISLHREYDKRHRLGTTMLMKDLNGIGILPTDHFKGGVCSYVDDVSGEKLAATYKVKNKSCFNCHIHCSRYYVVDGIEAEGPEFETLCGFTSRIGNQKLPFALEMNRTLNQYGMDSLAVCEIVGWLMECQERGLVTPEDVDGFRLSWGDCDAVRRLVELIAHRRGIGDALAEGATRFSKGFSPEAQRLVMQVKGLDIICGDPRGIKAYGLTYAVASRGADHLRAEPYFELTQRWDVAKQRFGTEKAADRLAEEGKAALVTYSEKIALLTDCLSMCKNVGLCMDVLNPENAAALLRAATGIDYQPEQLMTYLGEAIERDLRLNRTFGMTKADDTLPERFLTEPLTEGPTRGSVVNLEKMLTEYYRLHETAD